jgi:hypothetical protein
MTTLEQNEVIRFVEFLEFKDGEINLSPQIENTEQVSFAEAAKDFIGCLDGLPSDLSTNKSYMEGFGL